MATPEDTELIVDMNRIAMALADTRVAMMAMLNATSPLKASDPEVMTDFLDAVKRLQLRLRAHRE
jgi:type IV secretory pathway TrbL component